MLISTEPKALNEGEKMKLLVLDLENPCLCKYRDHKNIGRFIGGRKLSNHPMFSVDGDEVVRIEIENQEAHEIQKTVDHVFLNLKSE